MHKEDVGIFAQSYSMLVNFINKGYTSNVIINDNNIILLRAESYKKGNQSATHNK